MERTFWFGKYKGEQILTICKNNKSYISWCLANVKGFSLTEEERLCYNQSRCFLSRPHYDYDYERSIWDEFDDEMTGNMMNDFD